MSVVNPLREWARSRMARSASAATAAARRVNLLRVNDAGGAGADRGVDQRGSDLAGGAAGARVLVHPGGHRRPVGEKGELPSEALGVDRSRPFDPLPDQPPA